MIAEGTLLQLNYSVHDQMPSRLLPGTTKTSVTTEAKPNKYRNSGESYFFCCICAGCLGMLAVLMKFYLILTL